MYDRTGRCAPVIASVSRNKDCLVGRDYIDLAGASLKADQPADLSLYIAITVVLIAGIVHPEVCRPKLPGICGLLYDRYGCAGRANPVRAAR